MRLSVLLSNFLQVSAHSDGGYLALCPGHADSNPSLRIWRGEDNKVRLACRAGCATEDVIRAAGLSFSDLFNVEGVGSTVPSAAPEPVSDEPLAALSEYVNSTNAAMFGTEVGDTAREYARMRFGVDYELADALNLGADEGGPWPGFPYRSASFQRFPRLTVPLYDFEGNARGLQGRDLSGKCPARWVSLSNPKGERWSAFGVFRGHGGYGATIVTEGPGDALCATAVGYDSVAVRGAALAASGGLVADLARGLAGTQVIVCGDADAAGQTFVKRLTDGLRAHGITAYVLRLPAGVNDVAAWRERSPETFAAELHAAVRNVRPAAESEIKRVTDELARRTGADTVTADEGTEAAKVLAELVERYGESDAMNAYALVAWSGGRIRYARGLGFYVWNGRVWEHSDVKIRQEIHRMGAALVLAGKLHESRGFTMTTRIDALITELSSVPSVLVGVDDFDCHDHLLSFRNGTVDLRTGEMHAHDMNDMITRCLDVDYRPDSTCPRWEAFLTEIFPAAPDLVGYMQRLTGYGITGSTDEQCFAVLYGSGANGKSVFTDTLTSVFSVVTQTTRFATFEEKPNGAIPNDIAALRGARMVMSSEGGAMKRMDEESLKNLTGKDKIQARFLHKELFTYRPTFLIMLATNHKPNFVSQDEGLWRRVKMIPFTRYFAPHERDYDLDRKLLAEREGIAAWAVRGAVEWYQNGLGDPQVIRDATKEFRETSDVLSGFYPGVLEKAEGERLDGSKAYVEYRTWCEDEGLTGSDVKTRTMFYRLMEQRGVTKRKLNTGIVLEGVRIANPHEVTGPGIFAK